MPWRLLSVELQPGKKGLLIDYISPNPAVVIWQSLRNRHWPVFTSASCSLLITLVTVLSTSLFVLRPVLVDRTNAEMHSTSHFASDSFDGGSVGASPMLIASTILSENLSIQYPSYTNKDYAVESFEVPGLDKGKNLRGVFTAFDVGF